MDKLKSILPLNFELMGNPVNWVIVTLMIALAGVGLALIFPNIIDAIDEE